MVTCRIRGCDEPVVGDGFCMAHHQRFLYDTRWCPVRIDDTDGFVSTRCGLCDTPVWPLVRLDEDVRRWWPIETVAHPDGRVWIVDGGFRVVDGRNRDVLIVEGVPLYRTHPPACPERTLPEPPALVPSVGDTIDVTPDPDLL